MSGPAAHSSSECFVEFIDWQRTFGCERCGRRIAVQMRRDDFLGFLSGSQHCAYQSWNLPDNAVFPQHVGKLRSVGRLDLRVCRSAN